MTYSVYSIKVDNSISFTPGPTAGYVLSINTDGSTFWAPQSGGGGTSSNGPEIWTIELMDVQTWDFYAPYNLIIASVSNVLNSPTVTLFDDGATYSLGATISIGSVITTVASTQSVINLNITI